MLWGQSRQDLICPDPIPAIQTVFSGIQRSSHADRNNRPAVFGQTGVKILAAFGVERSVLLRQSDAAGEFLPPGPITGQRF